MPNGELPKTPFFEAGLMLLKEWQKQSKEHRFHTGKLRHYMNQFGGALVAERDRVELIVKSPEGFSLDPMVKQD